MVIFKFRPKEKSCHVSGVMECKWSRNLVEMIWYLQISIPQYHIYVTIFIPLTSAISQKLVHAKSERKQIPTCKPLSPKSASTKSSNTLRGSRGWSAHTSIRCWGVICIARWPRAVIHAVRWLRRWPWEAFQWMHTNIMNQIWCTWHCGSGSKQ